jgi:two-component system response regulator MprA
MAPERPTILVVEDDPALRDTLQRRFERAGYTVAAAADGATGLARAAAGDIDLVVLDLTLPDIDGLDVCRQLRRSDGEGYLPILILTGRDSPADRSAGFAAGADDYVAKPFEATELLARVEVWAHTRQRLQNAYAELHALAERMWYEQTQLRQLVERLLAALEQLDPSDSTAEPLATARDELEGVASALAARILTLPLRA